ncbi:unnamed protein product [Strongylus vulgaris]|uniref:glycerophosphocholine cholinephosphodiesterase n=1 Tax=Strongylus vulgaris TaxID=40348 RepID=A0A3P7KQS2_STRVU|nr:unnamed protein product [Strongylus vulgaris]
MSPFLAEGLSGAYFHRFSHLSGLRVFEEEGVWSTRLFPVFPTFPLPNRHTLMTGVLPRKHGMMSDFVFNWRSGQEFLNFSQESDFSKRFCSRRNHFLAVLKLVYLIFELFSDWWMTDPIYVTATEAKASVAMFFFPECKVDWVPAPHLCIPPRKDGLSFSDERIAKIVVEATKYIFVIKAQTYENRE